MTKPTPNELYLYFKELGCPNPKLESETFFDHFTSNGWKVGGKAPMKDWQSACRNWNRRNAVKNHAAQLRTLVETPTRQNNNQPKQEVLECAPPPEDWKKMMQSIANKREAV